MSLKEGTMYEETAVFTNMVMIQDSEGNVVVQNRVKGWKGLVFPGGHLNKKETFTESAIREVKEETGLDVSNLIVCGVKQWFDNDIRNVCVLFKTRTFSGKLKDSDEGHVRWMKLDELKHSSQVAHGFEIMLRLFLEDDVNEMYYPDNGDSEAKVF